MSIPDDRLSSLIISGHFLYPDSLDSQLLIDYELGGTDLNDPTGGLRVKVWTLRYYPGSGDMVISAPDVSPVILFNRAGITEISLAFDKNMDPFVAFVEAGQAKFWWFDTQAGMTVFTNLPAGSLTPRACHDDKRPREDAFSDVILCYVLDGRLERRQERGRYASPVILDNPFLHPTLELPAVLKRIGMNEHNRLQWLCDLANPIDWCEYVNYGN
jgi:hypothetical protein